VVVVGVVGVVDGGVEVVVVCPVVGSVVVVTGMVIVVPGTCTVDVDVVGVVVVGVVVDRVVGVVVGVVGGKVPVPPLAKFCISAANCCDGVIVDVIGI
jgi:hypothetical protein